MARKDFYYNKAKQEGYRTRAAYKLIQLDEREDVLSPGDAVVDLGAAPGGWLQVAAEAVGERGVVLGADRQRIAAFDDELPVVETIRGDITESDTRAEIRSRLPEGTADVVLSDMAPEMTGEYSLDQARSLHLAELAFEVATAVLAPGGDAVIKVFQGDGVDRLRSEMETRFEYVAVTSPEASRDASSELYLVGKRFLDPPVDIGDRVTVEIDDIGNEGDGIARIEGYTLFVPDAEVGETIEVSVDDLKATYGFARRVE